MDDLDKRFTEAEKECEMRINEFAENLQKQVSILELKVIALAGLLRDTASVTSQTHENLRQELDRTFKVRSAADTEEEVEC